MSRSDADPVAPDNRPRGLFAGLATLDLVQRVDALPGPDAKATATWQQLCAGGPALNAAVTFAALGGHATLLTRIGAGALASLVRDDLRRHGVRVVDLAAADYALSVSAIAVDARTGARQVISTDAGRAAPLQPEALDVCAQAAPDVLLLDGHHADVARAVLDRLDPATGLPVVLDAGRWKPPMADLVPRCTHVICSATFRLDGADSSDDQDGADSGDDDQDALLEALLARGARLAASTHGPDPIRWRTACGHGEVPVPPVEAVDTLGAGDALHGAYAWALAAGASSPADLRFAAGVAALSTTSRGTRAWLAELPDGLDPLGVPRPTPPRSNR